MQRRTLLLKNMDLIRSALNIPTRCGKSDRAHRRENGNILEVDATLILVN